MAITTNLINSLKLNDRFVNSRSISLLRTEISLEFNWTGRITRRKMCQSPCLMRAAGQEIFIGETHSFRRAIVWPTREKKNRPKLADSAAPIEWSMVQQTCRPSCLNTTYELI
jgi:hypothetical protein